MLKTSPNPVDVQDFQFKLHCKLKVFENAKIQPFSHSCNLLATASHHGLIFVGDISSFQVLCSYDLDQFSVKDGDKNNYLRREIVLNHRLSHLSVNCDNTILAVIMQADNCPVAHFYNIKSLLSENVEILNTLQLSPTPGVTVLESNWNPTVPEVFTACKSDGSLGVYEVKPNMNINELPVSAGATCFCWSPKGKQISVGSRDGKITQYKPDLKAVRIINAPPLQDPHMIIALQWISNYQFVGVFSTAKADASPNLIVIDAPKTGEASYTAYDDICYSSSPVRPIQFYMIHLQQWNILMVASANSMEVGVLYNVGETWTQLTLMDAARAELPLSHDHCDTLPVGFAFDTSSTQPIPWGESVIPPPPKLFILSHYGVLCCFNIVNLKENAPTICAPPVTFIKSSEALNIFTNKFSSIEDANKGGLLKSDSTEKLPDQPVSIQPAQNIPSSLSNIALPKKPVNQENIGSQPANLNFGSPNITSAFSSQNIASQFGAKNIFAGMVTQNISSGSQNFASDSQNFTLDSQNFASDSHNIFSGTQNMPLGSQNFTSGIQNFSPGPQTMAPGTQNVSSSFGNQSGSSGFNNQKVAPIFASPTATKETISPFSNFSSKLADGSNGPKDAEKPSITLSQLSKETNITKPKEVESSQPVQTGIAPSESETLNDNEINELLTQIIKDECIALESELSALLHQAKSLKIVVGTDQEKVLIADLTIKLENFLVEVVNNYTLQKSEVHVLKQNLIQTWAWLEEARSRHNAANDGTLATILRAQPLDSAAEKQLLHIRHLMYYLESQLKQAHDALDEQWETFQDYCRKTYKIQLPTMEAIFQSMVKHNAILNKLTYNLKDISTRIRTRNQVKVKSTPLVALKSLKKVEEDMKELSLEPQDVFNMHYERVMLKNKLLSQNKTSKLRQYLKKVDVRHVTSYKASVSQSEGLQQAIIKIKESSFKTSGCNAQESTLKTNIEPPSYKSEAKPSAFSFDADKNKSSISQKLVQQTKESASSLFFPKPGSSSPGPSAFVPTSHSTGLFETSSMGFKIPSFTPGETLFNATKPSTTTLVTTASPFATSSTKFVATTKGDTLLKSTFIQPPNAQSSFSFLPQKDVNLGSHSFNKNESPVIIVESANKPVDPTKPFSINLPSSEVSISKIAPSGSNKSLFNLPSDIQIAKLNNTTTSSVPPFDGVIVAKPFASSNFSTFSSTSGVSIVKPGSDVLKPATSTTKKESEQDPTKAISSTFPSATSTSSAFTFSALKLTDPNVTPSPAGKPDLSPTKSAELFGTVKFSTNQGIANSQNLVASAGDVSQSSQLLGTVQNLKIVPSPNIFAGTTVTSTVSTQSSEVIKSDSGKLLSSTQPTLAVTTSKSIFGNVSLVSDLANKTDTAVTTSSTFSTVSVPNTSNQTTLCAGISTSKLSLSIASTAESTNTSVTTANAIQSNIKSFTFAPKATPQSSVPSPQTSIFASSVQNSDVSSSATPQSPIFVIPNFATTTKASVFSSPSLSLTSAPSQNEASVTTTSAQSSVFDIANQNKSAITSESQTSIFSASTQNQLAATTSSQTSAFAAKNENKLTAASVSEPSVFGTSNQNQSSAPSEPQTSVFGISDQSKITSTTVSQAPTVSTSNQNETAATTVSQASLFSPSKNQIPTASPPETSVFGSVNQNQTTASSLPQTSIFGPKTNLVIPSTTSQTLFGTTNQSQAPISTVSQTSIFGTSVQASVTTASGQSSIFGGTQPLSFSNVASSVSKPSVFGTFTPTTGSIFGNTASTTTTTSSVFGNPIASTASSPFAASTGKSIFGSSTFAPASTSASPFGMQSSIFGAPKVSSAESNVFASQSSSFNAFGTSTSATTGFTQPSPFGSVFGSSNTSTSTSAPPSSSTGIGTSSSAFVNLTPSQFGTPASTSNVFGGAPSSQNTFSFATPSSNPSFGFGGLNVSSTTASNTEFGSSKFGTNANPFGKSNVFGTASTQSSSIFGGSSTFGASTQNTFGSSPAFGSTPAFGQQATFGQSTFGSSQPGPFSAGANNVAQSGFGSSPSFQKPTGFGSPPAFGAAPAFGSAPTFGGAPTFGSSPTFGTPEKVFGSNSPLTSGFQSTPENPTFANLATQNTVGFGSLAQQAQNQSSSPFSANSSFTSWR